MTALAGFDSLLSPCSGSNAGRLWREGSPDPDGWSERQKGLRARVVPARHLSFIEIANTEAWRRSSMSESPVLTRPPKVRFLPPSLPSYLNAELSIFRLGWIGVSTV